MAHVIVRMIEMLVCIGLAGAVVVVFALASIFIVCGLRSAGHPR